MNDVVSIRDIENIVFGGEPVTQINATTPTLQPDSEYQLIVYAIINLGLDVMSEYVAHVRNLSELHRTQS